MSDTESDEDLKRAITLSLQDSSSEDRSTQVIDLVSSEDEDDDLEAPVATKKTAPAGSIAEKSNGIVAKPVTKLPEVTIQDEEDPLTINNPSTPSQPSVSLSLLGLNRKQMEEERLARARKRDKKEGSHMEEANDTRKRKLSNSISEQQCLEARRVRARPTEGDLGFRREPAAEETTRDSCSGLGVVNPPRSEVAQVSPEVLSFKAQQALGSSGIQFPDGVVKKTWVYGCPREDDIKIEEVFQKDDLELAVLSSYQVDPQWVASKLDPTTKVVWVLQAKTEQEVCLRFLFWFP
jgi:hypothetical protein